MLPFNRCLHNVYGLLEGSGRPFQPKRHMSVSKKAMMRDERCFVYIPIVFVHFLVSITITEPAKNVLFDKEVEANQKQIQLMRLCKS